MPTTGAMLPASAPGESVAWFSIPDGRVANRLGVDSERGLTGGEASPGRQGRPGPQVLRELKPVPGRRS